MEGSETGMGLMVGYGGVFECQGCGRGNDPNKIRGEYNPHSQHVCLRREQRSRLRRLQCVESRCPANGQEPCLRMGKIQNQSQCTTPTFYPYVAVVAVFVVWELMIDDFAGVY